MLNFMSKIMLFHNFKYVENHAFGRKKMPGSQKDISLFPAMPQGSIFVKQWNLKGVPLMVFPVCITHVISLNMAH